MKKIISLFGLLILSACATNYGNIVPLGDGQYQIISTGDTRTEATSKALKGAESKCKSFSVKSKTEKYVGVFVNEEVHMQSKRLKDAVDKGSKSLGAFAPEKHVVNAASVSSESYFEDAFETTIDFICR